MNKQASTPYLALAKTAVTCFHWQSEKLNVRRAPPNIFDAWIRQYVENIVNVDTQLWDKFHRWQIINTVLAAGLLTIVEEDDGTLSLRATKSAEEKASQNLPGEEKSSATKGAEVPRDAAQELQASEPEGK